MEFRDLIKERYSCKKYSGRKIERHLLKEILNAGRLAPTARNQQEQRIYVLETEKSLAAFDAATPCRYGAPTVLIVAYDKNHVFVYPGGKHDSGAEDAAIVAIHMMLAAKNEGVESCWVNFLDPEQLAEALGIPENEQILMALDLGYPEKGAKPLPAHTCRKELSETVVYL